MNSKQLKLITDNMGMNDNLAEAVRLIIIDGLSGYAAELTVYGRSTMTSKRAEKRVRGIYSFSLLVAQS